MSFNIRHGKGSFKAGHSGTKSKVTKSMLKVINHITEDDPTIFVNHLIKLKKVDIQRLDLPQTHNYQLSGLLENILNCYNNTDKKLQPQVLALVANQFPLTLLNTKGFEITRGQYEYAKTLDTKTNDLKVTPKARPPKRTINYEVVMPLLISFMVDNSHIRTDLKTHPAKEPIVPIPNYNPKAYYAYHLPLSTLFVAFMQFFPVKLSKTKFYTLIPCNFHLVK